MIRKNHQKKILKIKSLLKNKKFKKMELKKKNLLKNNKIMVLRNNKIQNNKKLNKKLIKLLIKANNLLLEKLYHYLKIKTTMVLQISLLNKI